MSQLKDAAYIKGANYYVMTVALFIQEFFYFKMLKKKYFIDLMQVTITVTVVMISLADWIGQIRMWFFLQTELRFETNRSVYFLY